jgi:hypothetical protein
MTLWLLWHEFWETALDRLELYLTKLQAKKDKTHDRDA